MSFLPDVKVPCDVCHGQRFNPETLAVTRRGRNIGDADDGDRRGGGILRADLEHRASAAADEGCQPGYLTLGQPSPTLSGGEAQRIARHRADEGARRHHAARQKAPHTLYVLDEPTVGLHMADVAKLIRVLHRLVDAGTASS